MWSAPLYLVLSAPQPPPPPPAKPVPQATVEVSGRALLLPELPASVAAARKGFGAIHPALQASIQDLDGSLRDLYGKARRLPPLGASLKAPKYRSEETRFLTGLLNDPTFEALQGALVEAWDHWERALVANGLAEPLEAPGPTPSRTEPPRPEAAPQTRLKGFDGMAVGRDFQLWIMTVTGAFNAKTTVTHQEIDQNALATYASRHDRYDRGIALVRKKQVVADQEAPNLARTWQPLAAHLNGCVQKLLAFDGMDQADPGSPEYQALAVQSRITLLERFRATLWFSDVVWSLMAARDLPADLKDCSQPAPH